jgi:hypothetical protein
MFKRTAVPPVGSSDHQARQPLNMALDLMTEESSFRYIPEQGAWYCTESEGTFEILIGGSVSEPDRELLGLAHLIVPLSDVYLERSQAYLAEFVKFDPLGIECEKSLELVGLEFTSNASEFLVVMALSSDIYGSWSVRYRLGTAERPGEFYPVFFARTQV